MAEDVCNFSGQNQACKGFHSESAWIVFAVIFLLFFYYFLLITN
jgi:hypothetical protein